MQSRNNQQPTLSPNKFLETSSVQKLSQHTHTQEIGQTQLLEYQKGRYLAH